MNLQGMRADLILKQVALKDAERTLTFFSRSNDCSPDLIKEMRTTIDAIKRDIKELERSIKKAENVKKKK